MIAKFREELIKYFDEPIDEKPSSFSLSLTPIFLWAAIAGIVGGLASFVFPSNHGLLLSSIIALLFLILTAKPVFIKWIYSKNDEND